MALYNDFFKTTNNTSRTYDILTEESIVWRESNSEYAGYTANEKFSTSDLFSDIINNDNGKGEPGVSYVGVLIFCDAVYAFADSKSSVETIFGFDEEPGRGNVQKIFKNNTYLLAAYNANSFVDKNGGIIHLEQWMNDNMTDGTDALHIMGKLYRAIFENPSNNKKSFDFIEGGFDETGSYARVFNVSFAGIFIGCTNREKRPLTGGPKYYISDEMNSRLLNLMRMKEHEDFERELLDEVRRIVDEASAIGGYNPAGPPIYTEHIKKEDAMITLKGMHTRTDMAKLF